ncbi:MAG: prolipoprotein diacylglyceryl transferase [Pseudomonadota bacterium]
MSLLAMTVLSFPEISPAVFQIDLGFLGLGKFPIRWYALAYIAGLLLAWRYAIYMINRPQLFGGTSPATKDDIDDIIFYVMLGVILGGRLGYILFYQVPFQADRIASDPMMLLRVWEGGMSFHGGLIGVALALLYAARSRGLKLLNIADIAGVVTPIGLLLGRTANFINAELYGRHTESSFGMVFPESNQGGTPPAYNWDSGEWVYSGLEMARHPSQLYEAGLEGLLPLILISVLVLRFRILERPGLAAGIFLILYGVGRSIAEQFREPDQHINFIAGDWLTMGMLLSLPVWIGGAYLLWQGFKTKPATDTAKA